MSAFFDELDRKEQEARISRIFSDRPDNLHDYQGCENDRIARLKQEHDAATAIQPLEVLMIKDRMEESNFTTQSIEFSLPSLEALYADNRNLQNEINRLAAIEGPTEAYARGKECVFSAIKSFFGEQAASSLIPLILHHLPDGRYSVP